MSAVRTLLAEGTVAALADRRRAAARPGDDRRPGRGGRRRGGGLLLAAPDRRADARRRRAGCSARSRAARPIPRLAGRERVRMQGRQPRAVRAPTSSGSATARWRDAPRAGRRLAARAARVRHVLRLPRARSRAAGAAVDVAAPGFAARRRARGRAPPPSCSPSDRALLRARSTATMRRSPGSRLAAAVGGAAGAATRSCTQTARRGTRARAARRSAPLLAAPRPSSRRARRPAPLVMRTADGQREGDPARPGSSGRCRPNTHERRRQARASTSRAGGSSSPGEPRESNTEGGIFPAIFGTALMVLLMTVAVVPLGVVTAVYLNEYARDRAFTARGAPRARQPRRRAVDRLRRLRPRRSSSTPSAAASTGCFFSDALPTPTFGTGGILWASLTLALLTVPVVVVATEEGLQSVPQAVRDGARALGATTLADAPPRGAAVRHAGHPHRR